MKNFTFFVSYYEAVKELPDEQQGAVYKAVVDYAMVGTEPSLTGVAKSIFILIKPYLDSQKKNAENGSKGGRPPKEKTESETQTKTQSITQHETQTETESETQTETNNIHENEDEYKEENKYENELLFVNNNARTQEDLREPYLKFFNNFFDYHTEGKFYDAAIEIVDEMINSLSIAAESGFKFNHKTYSEKELSKVYSNIEEDKFYRIVEQITFNEEIDDKPRYIMGCVINAGDVDINGRGGD